MTTTSSSTEILGHAEDALGLTREQVQTLQRNAARLKHEGRCRMVGIHVMAGQIVNRRRSEPGGEDRISSVYLPIAGMVIDRRPLADLPLSDFAREKYAGRHEDTVPIVSDGTAAVALVYRDRKQRGPVDSLPVGSLVSLQVNAYPGEPIRETEIVDGVWYCGDFENLRRIAPGDDEDAIDYSDAYSDTRGGGWKARRPQIVERARYRPPEYLEGSAGAALLYRGMRHLISGKPEVGKTWIAAAAATQMLARRQAQIVWFDSDDVGESVLVERLISLGATDKAIEERLLYVATPARDFDVARTAVRGIAGEYAPALVVWDGWNAALAMTSSGMDEAGVVAWRDAFLTPFRDARPGCTSLITDHVAREASASDIYSYGAQGKLAQVDVHLRVVQRRDTMFSRVRSGEISITVMKDRPGGLDWGGYRMPVTPTDGRLEWDITIGARVTPEEREDLLIEQITDALIEGGPMAKGAIEKVVVGKNDAIRAGLSRLVGSGVLALEKGPRGAMMYSLPGVDGKGVVG